MCGKRKVELGRKVKTEVPSIGDKIVETLYLRADVSKYRPEVYKTEKSKILKKIHKVALGKLLTQM